MVIEQWLGMLPMIGETEQHEEGQGRRGGGLGRRGAPMPGPMLIAAVIAAGLVALWVALSLIAAG